MGKIKTLIFLIVLLGQSAFAKWTFHRQFGRTKIFKDENLSARLITNYSTTTPKLSRPNYSKKNLDKLLNARKKAMKFTGVTEWSLNESKVVEEANLTKVILIGSYLDSLKKKIFFKEFHYYAPSAKLQVLTTVNKKENLVKLTEDRIKRIKFEYGF